jgi:hypothetical protein
MNFKGFLLTIYIGITAFMFINLNVSIPLWISFFLTAVILFLITTYHLYYEKEYSPFLSSFIVFTFLFFLAAPIAQINSFENFETAKFANNFPYRENTLLYTNILINVFNTIFITSYIFLKRRILNNIKIAKEENKALLPLTILVLLGISIIIFIASYNFLKVEFSRPAWLKSETSVMSILIWKKVLLMIPFAGIILCFKYLIKRPFKKANFIYIILFLLVLIGIFFWFKNPFTEKRNALGPIFLSLIFLCVPRVLNSNVKTLSFLFFSMIIAFPLLAMLTHSDASFSEIYNNPSIIIDQMKGGGIIAAFNTLNYDAFSNIGVTVDYVNKYGFSYGYQFLGGLLFFIPRIIWTNKPFSTGQVVGEHLIDDYGFNFSNLSNSLVSESFINFGIIGTMIIPIILAIVIIHMIRWLKSDNYLKKIMAFYFAMHLIFLLRGDFSNGFTYFIGPLIAVVYFPKIIERIIKELLIFSKHEINKITK